MIKKFSTTAEAMAAGFYVDLGGDGYAQGGETVPRWYYGELFAALHPAPLASEFQLPDLRLQAEKAKQ